METTNMFKSIFTDELGMDLEQALPILKSWGLNRCDLRSKIMQMPFEKLEADQLRTVKTLLDNAGFRLGCLESSLAKVHLPGPDVIAAEADKLERIIQAADILDCRLVRSFFFWQPPRAELGDLATRPELLAKVLDAFQPLPNAPAKQDSSSPSKTVVALPTNVSPSLTPSPSQLGLCLR